MAKLVKELKKETDMAVHMFKWNKQKANMMYKRSVRYAFVP